MIPEALRRNLSNLPHEIDIPCQFQVALTGRKRGALGEVLHSHSPKREDPERGILIPIDYPAFFVRTRKNKSCFCAHLAKPSQIRKTPKPPNRTTAGRATASSPRITGTTAARKKSSPRPIIGPPLSTENTLQGSRTGPGSDVSFLQVFPCSGRTGITNLSFGAGLPVPLHG
jgi:hypothetical protein